MTTILIVIHVIVSLFLICIVLLQHGKGADIGATFGGSSQSLFGTEGPLPLLNKITTGAAIVFMTTSVTLAYISAHKSSGSVMSNMPAVQEQQQAQPVQTTATPVAPQSGAPAEPKKSEAPAKADDQAKGQSGPVAGQQPVVPAQTEAAAPAQKSAAPQPQEKP